MKNLIALIFLASNVALASDLQINLDTVANASTTALLEVCGKVTSTNQKWPISVTVADLDSNFSTMTNKNGKFCVLIARKTNDSTLLIEANTLDSLDSGKLVYKIEPL